MSVQPDEEYLGRGKKCLAHRILEWERLRQDVPPQWLHSGNHNLASR